MKRCRFVEVKNGLSLSGWGNFLLNGDVPLDGVAFLRLPYGTDGDARLTPKGDHLGVAQGFCDP